MNANLLPLRCRACPPDVELVFALLDHVPAMLAYWDRAQRCRFANRAYETWFGVNPKQFLGRHISELLGPLYELNRSHIEGALRGEPQQFERIIPDPKGGPARRSQADYIPHVVEGIVQGFFVLVTDVTARKRAEEAARAAERELALTFENAPIGMAIVGLDGHWHQVNRVLADLLGYAPEELVGLTFQDVTHLDDLATDLAEVERLLRGDKPRYSLEKRYLRRDHSVVPVMLHVALVRDENRQPKHFICQIEDLSEQKRLRQRLMAADRLATVGTLAAGVAHEINNPLTYILANLELLQQRLRQGPPAQRDLEATVADTLELVTDARDGAERVRRIVADLTTFARSSDETLRPVDVVHAMNVALTMTAAATKHRARVQIRYEDVPAVLGDDTKLAQVFINLLTNAAQALRRPAEARDGGNRIDVRIAKGGDGQVVIEVTDNGDGIAPDVLPRVFEPFMTTKAVGAGTGLGLSICRNIVTSFGGEIDLDSDVGIGTTARVTLRAA